MQPLTSYIYDKLYTPTIDAHIHCIGGKEIPRTADIQVCALNDWPDAPREKNYPEFKKFFKKKNKEDIVLGIGANNDEMFEMLKDDKFDGFGEFLGYKITKEDNVVKNMNIVKKVAEMTSKPIYLHYDLLPKNIDALEKFLKSTSNSKIVLTHCGLSRRTDDKEAWKMFVRLINENSNLYGDISWHTLTYLVDNMELLKDCPQNKLICGTDCSERDSEEALKHRKENFEKIAAKIPNTYNVKRLFQRGN